MDGQPDGSIAMMRASYLIAWTARFNRQSRPHAVVTLTIGGMVMLAYG